MWVYSPLDEVVTLPWNRRGYPVKKGLNEIPEPVAHAYFVFGLPDDMVVSPEDFDALVKQALYRWGVVMKKVPPKKDFLEQFVLSGTREGLEDELISQNLIDGPVNMREKVIDVTPKSGKALDSPEAIHQKLVEQANLKRTQTGATAK